MAKFWAKRIKYDVSRIDEVPALWREAAREMCEEKGEQPAKGE